MDQTGLPDKNDKKLKLSSRERRIVLDCCIANRNYNTTRLMWELEDIIIEMRTTMSLSKDVEE